MSRRRGSGWPRHQVMIHRGHVPTKVTPSLDGKTERVVETFYRWSGPQTLPKRFQRTHWRKRG